MVTCASELSVMGEAPQKVFLFLASCGFSTHCTPLTLKKSKRLFVVYTTVTVVL